MVDFKKLDSFFDTKNLKKKSGIITAVERRAKYVRFVKILLPALAAAMIGLLAIIPSLKDRAAEFSIDISQPKLSDLEKLHMENTVFQITDKNNRVNNFTADTIKETEVGSHLIKLFNPKGKIPSSDTDWLDVQSPIGYYNQETKVLSLNDDVTMIYSDGMKAITKEMFYDASESRAYGNEPVTATGYFGDLKSQGFEYLKDNKIMTFTKKTIIDFHQDSLKGTKITADKKVEVFQDKNKVVATGNAIAHKDGNKIYGNTLIAFFAKAPTGPKKGKTEVIRFEAYVNVKIETSQGEGYGSSLIYKIKDDEMILKGSPAKIKNDRAEISATNNITYYPSREKAIATGNVIVDNGENKVYSDKMDIYFKKDAAGKLTTDRVEIPQNPKIVTKDGTVIAKTGIYYPNTGMVMLFEDVEIVQNNNIMKGDRAETNLNTGISKILAGQSGRVTGVLFEEDLKPDK